MRALVAVKKVVDYAVKVRVKSDCSAVETNNIKMSINPFCEIAVEEGVRLKEKGHISELIAVSCGPETCRDTLMHALALGADRAILIKTNMRTDQELQPLAVAKLMREIADHEKIDLVLLGKQAIDDDSNQTAQLLAGLLHWPQATFISELTFADNSMIEAIREVDDGLEHIKFPLPAIVSCDLRLNQPRYASLPNLMKAKKKKIDIMDSESMGVDIKPRLQYLSVNPPPKRVGGNKVDSVDELIEKLKNDGLI
eukprot:GHVL01025165.1.p1 GENE.GHVL01025165.1~~GHVL01025165.1.p1  ORF type:complete len:266 (+),score=62.89 GHVL01025165.1:39-800(+)